MNSEPSFNSKRIAKYRGWTFKLIKKENKRIFIKTPNKEKPFWINESEIHYTFDSTKL